jgi:hypothetical protein
VISGFRRDLVLNKVFALLGGYADMFRRELPTFRDGQPVQKHR